MDFIEYTKKWFEGEIFEDYAMVGAGVVMLVLTFAVWRFGAGHLDSDASSRSIACRWRCKPCHQQPPSFGSVREAISGATGRTICSKRESPSRWIHGHLPDDDCCRGSPACRRDMHVCVLPRTLASRHCACTHLSGLIRLGDRLFLQGSCARLFARNQQVLGGVNENFKTDCKCDAKTIAYTPENTT